jgi:hypothetical protein
MQLYGGFGIKASPFRQLKDEINRILVKDGIVTTFGYQSTVMGKTRGYKIERIALLSHGGAIHDTIATIERKTK